MTMKAAFVFLLAAVAALHTADAQSRRGEQNDVYQEHREGALKSLRDIYSGVVPGMARRGAAYIGAEFDRANGRYRLKFMRNGSVIWVDVDGRTGAVLARAGD